VGPGSYRGSSKVAGLNLEMPLLWALVLPWTMAGIGGIYANRHYRILTLVECLFIIVSLIVSACETDMPFMTLATHSRSIYDVPNLFSITLTH
jgi:hypothetical protein